MTEESLIDQAQKAAARLEHANKVMEELVKRQEALEASRLLGGFSEAGQKPVEITQDARTKMDMKLYFKGTAIEKALQ